MSPSGPSPEIPAGEESPDIKTEIPTEIPSEIASAVSPSPSATGDGGGRAGCAVFGGGATYGGTPTAAQAWHDVRPWQQETIENIHARMNTQYFVSLQMGALALHAWHAQ